MLFYILPDLKYKGSMKSKTMPFVLRFFSGCRSHLLCSCLSSHSLPKVVKRRVNALKNLQVKCAHIEAKFYEEVHELERKYAALYQPLFDKVCPVHISFLLTIYTCTQGCTEALKLHS